MVVDGEVLVGPNAVAGEWGHNALPWPDESEWPGPPCYCGRRGCIETFLSGSGLQTRLCAGAEASPRARSRSPPIVATRDAAVAIETYARRLAKSLATVINLLDPDAIVLGGGLSNIDSLYRRVPADLDRLGVFGPRRHAARAREARRLERRPRRGVAVAGLNLSALSLGLRL